jgi:porin
VRGNSNYFSDSCQDASRRAKKLSKYSLCQTMSIAGKLLVLSMAIALSAFPAWANEQLVVSTDSEDVSFDIEEFQQELEELSQLFDSDRVPTIADLPVYSTQAKDILVQNTTELIAEPTTETPSDRSNPAESKDESKPLESNPSPKPVAPDPFASKLGGDWGGFRRDLAANGVGFDLSATQFYQGLVSGSGNRGFDYTGILDLFLNIDTKKAGLWEGGAISTHLIYAYGTTSLAKLGNSGAILPANTALFEHQLRGNAFEVSSFYITQKLGDTATLSIGKFNVFDLVSSDPFLGGRGTDRFMNIALSTPPTGVTPPITFGALAQVKAGDVGLSFMVFDPNDRWGKGLENLFSNGVGLSATAQIPAKMFGHTATHTLSVAYNTKTGTNLADSQLLLPNPPTPLSQKSGFYNISYQYNQFFYENPKDPKDRWGMFFKAAIADGNPNIISYTILAGLGGSAPWRSQDSFGLGYFYYGFSGALKETFRPILTLGDEQGVEMYYKAALTPWLNLTADLQIISPAIKSADTAFVLGFRLGATF